MAIATVSDDEDLFDRALKGSSKGKANQSEPEDIFDRVLQKAGGGKVAPAQPAATTQAPAKPAGKTRSFADFVLEQQPKETSQATKAKASVITDELLDSLRKVESGKDRFAVNKQTKAMGPYQFLPETVQSLHKQGIEFNPFNEAEARNAAKLYLESLVKKTGSLDKALAAYGGFVTKDPTSYVQKVTQGAKTESKVAEPTTAATAKDELGDLILGKSTTAKPAPAAAPAAAPVAAPAAPTTQPKVASLGERLLRSGAGLADTVLGGIQALPGTAAAEVGYAGVRGLEALGLAEPGRAERGRAAVYKKFVEPYTQPVGQALGVTETPEYKGEASQQLMKFIGENISKGVDWLSRNTGLPKADIENMMATAGLAAPAASKALVSEARMIAGAVKPEPKPPTARVEPTIEGRVEPSMTGRVSVGAAAVPDAMTVRQALAVASPELRAEIARIPADKVNLQALQRQIEADSIGVRLTEGQAVGDPIKLSNEMNRRGRDTEIATRLNEQNQRLINAIDETKDIASPDAFGARTMDNGQAIIDAYKSLDDKLNVGIDAKYKALRDAAGGQFPVDAPLLLKNVQTKLKKELLSNDAPPSQFKELERLASENAMTFEDFLSLRRNLGQIARTSPDGNVRTAAGYMIEELEKLPLQEGAKKLKPLADQARKAARDRFQMLEKDPAYRAVVDNKIAPEKFIDKFVINGINKNIQTMLSHLDDTSRQHMAAGVINHLRERGVPAGGNFRQSGYNNALTALDKSDKLSLIFDPESASRLKTIGAVGKYTQAQPAGYFGNHSNTFVSALADRGKALIGKGAETGINILVPGAQLGSAIMEGRARRAAAKETQRALKPGAGIRNE